MELIGSLEALCWRSSSGLYHVAFVDMSKTADERFYPILDYIMEPLTPVEWFVEGHGLIGGKNLAY